VDKGYIDFISAYCDRWCERCAFTARCSAFAVTAATAMCGDFKEGLELALGAPQPAGPAAGPSEVWYDDSEEIDLSPAETAESIQREQESAARLDESSILKVSLAAAILSHRWLTGASATLLSAADDVVREAIEVAGYDAAFIHAKLYRALKGRDDAEHGDDDGEDERPGQQDWNGSAKVALISLERSSEAWLTIARATLDDTPRELAAQLRSLQQAVEGEFPDAWRFVRPGFDDTES
jgi:hypothetical protein